MVFAKQEDPELFLERPSASFQGALAWPVSFLWFLGGYVPSQNTRLPFFWFPSKQKESVANSSSLRCQRQTFVFWKKAPCKSMVGRCNALLGPGLFSEAKRYSLFQEGNLRPCFKSSRHLNSFSAVYHTIRRHQLDTVIFQKKHTPWYPIHRYSKKKHSPEYPIYI